MLNNSLKSLKRLAHGRYYLISIALVALGIYLAAALIFNHQFVVFTLSSHIFSFGERWSLIFGQIKSFPVQTGLGSQILLILVAIFASINLNLFHYYIKRRIKSQKAEGLGFAGVLLGFLGVGCGACGSVLLTTVFGVGATSQVIGFLPWHGQELSYLSIIILIGSTVFIAQRVEDPDICPIH